MSLHTHMLDTIAFEDPSLANQLFGPRNVHLELLSSVSGAEIDSRGTSIVIDCSDQRIRQTLGNLFVQLYDLLREGITLGQQDYVHAYEMLQSDPHLNLASVFGNLSGHL